MLENETATVRLLSPMWSTANLSRRARADGDVWCCRILMDRRADETTFNIFGIYIYPRDIFNIALVLPAHCPLCKVDILSATAVSWM